MAHVQLPEQDDVLLCRQVGGRAGSPRALRGVGGGPAGVPGHCSLLSIAPHLHDRCESTCPAFSGQESNTCRMGGCFEISIGVFLVKLGDESSKKSAQRGKWVPNRGTSSTGASHKQRPRAQAP